MSGFESTDLVDPGSGDAGPDDLDRCDGYVVLVVDPQTGDMDSFGPYPHPLAVVQADTRARELGAEGLDDVEIRVARHHDRAGRLARGTDRGTGH